MKNNGSLAEEKYNVKIKCRLKNSKDVGYSTPTYNKKSQKPAPIHTRNEKEIECSNLNPL